MWGKFFHQCHVRVIGEPGESVLAADQIPYHSGQPPTVLVHVQAGGAGANTPRTAPGQEPAPAPPARRDVAFQSDDTTQYPTSARVEVPELEKLSGHVGTVSFWLQPNWQEGNQDDADFIDVGGRLQVLKNVNYVRFEFTDDQGLKGGVGAPIASGQVP